jgi:hypothetical protein
MQQIGDSDGGRPGGSVGVGRSRSGVAAASVPVEGGPTSAAPVEATQQETWRPAALIRTAENSPGGVPEIWEITAPSTWTKKNRRRKRIAGGARKCHVQHRLGRERTIIYPCPIINTS